MSTSTDGIVILGAGLAGLGCALEAPGSVLYEASDHVGGHASSSELAGVSFDEGAHISHATDEAFLSLTTAGRDDIHAFSSIVRNRADGQWSGYPVQSHLADLPADLRTAALGDLVMAHVSGGTEEVDDYRQWCLRQYGATLTDRFYERYTRKYWRCDASDLATDWLGGRLMPSDLRNVINGAIGTGSESQAVFARFRYPESGGFFSLFDHLYEGLDIRLEHRAVEIDTERREVTFDTGDTAAYETLASSIPLPILVGMLSNAPTEVRDAATRLRHTRLACVNVVLKRPITDMHWCYIYDEDIEPARVSFPSNLAPGSAGDGRSSLQAEVFRAVDESWNLDQIHDTTVAQMGALFGFDPGTEVIASEVRPIEYAYVVSDGDRAPAVAVITEWLAGQEIHTMGLYGTWEYMWSDQAMASGLAAARATGISR